MAGICEQQTFTKVKKQYVVQKAMVQKKYRPGHRLKPVSVPSGTYGSHATPCARPKHAMAAAGVAAAATQGKVSKKRANMRAASDKATAGRDATFSFDESELKPEDIILDLPLRKLCTSSYDGRTWQRRRVVVTSHGLFCFRESSSAILDMVPLHEVTAIQFGTYAKFRRARALFRAATFENSRQKQSAGNIAAMLGHMQQEFSQHGSQEGPLEFWMRKKGAVNPAWKRSGNTRARRARAVAPGFPAI